MNQRERGAASVELALMVPAVVLILAAMVAGWRIWSARTEVNHAAQAAARAASQQRSGAEANERAVRVLDAQLAELGFTCRERGQAVDTSGFHVAAGQAASVSVRVSCEVDLGDLLLPGLPGSIRADARATAPLDTFAERRP